MMSEIRRISKHICLFSLLLCVAVVPACGFRLSDAGESLPAVMQKTGLSGASGDLYRELRQGFSAAGASLHEGAIDGAGLRILAERFDKDILSVDVAGKVLEYGLFYTLEFDVAGADGMVMVEPQRLSLRRDYSYVDGDVYGTSRQEQLLRDQMRREMAGLMLRRIRALAR